MSAVADQRWKNFIRWMDAMGLNANRIHKETGVAKMTVSDYVTKKTTTLGGDKEAAIASHYGYSVHAIFGPDDPDLREPSFATAWRERAHLTIEQVAQMVGTTAEIQSLVEKGELPLVGKRRRALAAALGIHEGFLSIDPRDADNSLFVAAIKLPKQRRRDGERVLKALSEDEAEATGTDG